VRDHSAGSLRIHGDIETGRSNHHAKHHLALYNSLIVVIVGICCLWWSARSKGVDWGINAKSVHLPELRHTDVRPRAACVRVAVVIIGGGCALTAERRWISGEDCVRNDDVAEWSGKSISGPAVLAMLTSRCGRGFLLNGGANAWLMSSTSSLRVRSHSLDGLAMTLPSRPMMKRWGMAEIEYRLAIQPLSSSDHIDLQSAATHSGRATFIP